MVEEGTFTALKELATSKFWVDNFTKGSYIYKSKKQIYIQTWHGDKGFKKILYDVWPDGKRPTPLKENKICDLAIAGSDYGEMQYRSAFRYTGDILKVGYPRNDILLENSIIKRTEIKKILNIEDQIKIVLFAPTLRKESIETSNKQQFSNIDLLEIVNTLEQVSSDRWLCLIRAHSAVIGLDNIPTDSRFLDVSNYEDMSDILLISDILITDYSSCAGDFALLNRPIILFQNDRENYLEKDRTFYFDIDKSPFKVAMNQFEIISFIKNLDDFDAKKNCEEILQFYGSHETGKASYAIVDYIISNIEGDEK